MRTAPYRIEDKLVGVCSATLVHTRGESWCRRFRTDSEQFQMQRRQNSDCNAFTTSDVEEDVSSSSTWMSHSTVFLLGCRQLSILYFVLVTVESSARHFAAVDLERSGSDDKTWRRSDARSEDTTTKSWCVILVTINKVRE